MDRIIIKKNWLEVHHEVEQVTDKKDTYVPRSQVFIFKDELWKDCEMHSPPKVINAICNFHPIKSGTKIILGLTPMKKCIAQKVIITIQPNPMIRLQRLITVLHFPRTGTNYTIYELSIPYCMEVDGDAGRFRIYDMPITTTSNAMIYPYHRSITYQPTKLYHRNTDGIIKKQYFKMVVKSKYPIKKKK